MIIHPHRTVISTGIPRLSPMAQCLRLTAIGLVSADVCLIWLGLQAWPELTLLSAGIIGLSWVFKNLAPFRAQPAEGNPYSQAGAMVRSVAILGSPVIAALVVAVPLFTYQLGAGLIALLFGAGTLLFWLGKVLELKALWATLAACAALTAAAWVLPAPPRTSPPPRFEPDITTDVKLTIRQPAENRPRSPGSIGYACYAILPKTWFTARPLVYLTVVSTAFEAEPQVELPYNALGYVIETRDNNYGLGKAYVAEVEVTAVFPGESRDVLAPSVKNKPF